MTTDLSRVDTATPAVVLKFDPNVLHHGGLGAIRSLGRLGVPVYGVHEGPLAPAANSRYLTGRMFWQPSPDHAERVHAGLRQLARQIGRPAVLIPTDDAGAIFLAEHGAGLREDFLFAAPPPGLPRRLAGKYSMFQLCRDLGVPTPHAMLPGSGQEASDFAKRTGFPVIAKLTSPWQHSAGGAGLHGASDDGAAQHGPSLRSTSIIRDQRELEDIYRACDRAGAGLMLQEYIPGGPGQDWFFHGYCAADAACRPAFTGIKERAYPAHAGLTSLGRAAENSALRSQIVALLSLLGYRGITDLDLRYDPRDGQYKLLDFNPRVGAQFRLFADSAGLDVVRAAYLDLTGQPVPDGDMLSGRRYLVENYDPIGAVGYWRSGELGLKSWAASLRGVDETAWFARDDLRPFGLMCLRMGWRAVSRRFARAGRASQPADRPRYRRGRAAGAGPGGAGSQPITGALSRRGKPEFHQEGERV